jgi:hypothetical protein
LAAGDFQINSRVRGIFSKHWLDISRLSVVTIKGNIYIGGNVRKLPSVSSDIKIDKDLMETIDFEIGRIKGVKRITYRLEDWRKEAGKFISFGHKKVKEEEEKKKSEERARRAGFIREE